jgi:DNA polymerase-3 subunit gamma/tau
MAEQTLAVKYRPETFDDVTEQESIKAILQNQIKNKTTKNAYLFVGDSGTGKTTTARIFAHEINDGHGNPIELDAASNNGIDDVREIIQQAQTRALDSEYKVFIIDECHALSNAAWQALLKLLEEPPICTVFLLCTTEPQKVPKTILSRVQRFDFKRISSDGIIARLKVILKEEEHSGICEVDALSYIAGLDDDGMRDAITLLDKCLAYSNDLTLANIMTVGLDTVDYTSMFDFTDLYLSKSLAKIIAYIETLSNSGKDLKAFIKQYLYFVLNIDKYCIGCPWEYLTIPQTDVYSKRITAYTGDNYIAITKLLRLLMELNSSIKYSASPKYDIEAAFLAEV